MGQLLRCGADSEPNLNLPHPKFPPELKTHFRFWFAPLLVDTFFQQLLISSNFPVILRWRFPTPADKKDEGGLYQVENKIFFSSHYSKFLNSFFNQGVIWHQNIGHFSKKLRTKTQKRRFSLFQKLLISIPALRWSLPLLMFRFFFLLNIATFFRTELDSVQNFF